MNLLPPRLSSRALSLGICLVVAASGTTGVAQSPELDEAKALREQATSLYDKGRYAEAIPLAERALAIYEKVVGPDDRSTAIALDKLAQLYSAQGQHAKAELLYVRLLAVCEKLFGPEHLAMAVPLKGLANCYQDRGQYAKAEPLFVRALAICEKALGPDAATTSIVIYGLAECYLYQGRYAKAEPLFVRSVAIREKEYGPEHPRTATALTALALLYRHQGQYAKAEPLLLRALAIDEKALGPDHPSTAITLKHLAQHYGILGRYEKSEPLLLRGLAIQEKALGPDHPMLAETRASLATFYVAQRQYAKAEPLLLRALAICEKALGPDHPSMAVILYNLAALYLATEQHPRAVEAHARAAAVRERDLVRNLASGSEQEKLLYLDRSEYELHQTLSFHEVYARSNARAMRLALEIVLRRKGRALDAVARQIESLRQRATPEDVRLLDELASARSEVSRLTLSGQGLEGGEAYRSRLATLEHQVEELQGELARRSAQFAIESVPITLEAVQAAIPDGVRLVEFVSYRPWAVELNDYGRQRYLAYITGRDARIAFVDLGDAAPIDALVAQFRTLVRSSEPGAAAKLRSVARRLDEAVTQPIRPHLGSSRELFISPDGALNLVPFAALVDETNKYLVETYEIQYLTSGRDLLRLVARPAGSAPAIVANPDFGSRMQIPTDRALELDASAVDLSRVYFAPLPGTAEEAQALQRAMPAARSLTERQATEGALKRLRSPSILHIATHGFFLEAAVAGSDLSSRAARGLELAASSDREPKAIENPLLRSGLGLAGANSRQGGDGEDGILTALEASGLDLWGTELVVLSACDTGVGEVKTGDGVYGLRRALVLAGVATTLMSLWPVSDTGTRDLMIEYYRKLLAGASRSEALRQTQLEMLTDPARRHPFYWASFVQSGASGRLAT